LAEITGGGLVAVEGLRVWFPIKSGLLLDRHVGDIKAVDELAVIPGSVPNLIDLPTGCRFAPRCLARIEANLTIAEERHPDLLPVSPGHDVRCWLYRDASGALIPEEQRSPVARRAAG